MEQRKRAAKKRIEQEEVALMKRDSGTDAALTETSELFTYIELLDDIEGLDALQKRFLANYIQCGTILRACMNASVRPSQHYGWLSQPRYKEAFDEVKRFSNERLESLAYDLASGRFSRPIASAGKVVAYEQVFDTKLLQTLLRARMPERFAQKVDITSNGHSLVKIVDKDAWDSI